MSGTNKGRANSPIVAASRIKRIFNSMPRILKYSAFIDEFRRMIHVLGRFSDPEIIRDLFYLLQFPGGVPLAIILAWEREPPQSRLK